MNSKLFTDTQRDRTWCVKVLEQGDKYGLNGCLTFDGGDALVEFYDMKHDQFVSRYYVSTLIARKNPGRGLNLHGGVPEWSIDVECYERILDWLEGQ